MCYWLGLDEAPSGTRENYCRALRDTNCDSPLTQPPLKFFELRFQVADKQRRLTGRGYDGRVVRVEGQLDVLRRWGHVVDIQTEEDRGAQSPQAICLEELTWPSGRKLRPSHIWGSMRLYELCKTASWGALARRGGHRFWRYRRLSPRRGKLRRWASFVEISGYSYKAGQLHGLAMAGSKPKLLFSHQSAFVYYM